MLKSAAYYNMNTLGSVLTSKTAASNRSKEINAREMEDTMKAMAVAMQAKDQMAEQMAEAMRAKDEAMKAKDEQMADTLRAKDKQIAEAMSFLSSLKDSMRDEIWQEMAKEQEIAVLRQTQTSSTTVGPNIADTIYGR